MATVESLPKSAYEIMDVKSFGEAPVLVLTSSKPRKRDSDETKPAFEKWRIDQLAWLTSLARMSSRGTGPVVIPDSNHASMVMTRKGAAACGAEDHEFPGPIYVTRRQPPLPANPHAVLCHPTCYGKNHDSLRRRRCTSR